MWFHSSHDRGIIRVLPAILNPSSKQWASVAEHFWAYGCCGVLSNARDAMPQGGTLSVETSRVNVGPDFVRRKVSESKDFDGGELLTMPEEGNYVRLVVRDTGIGMDAATKRWMFMPFFTTKAVGKGTGMGLSVVVRNRQARRMDRGAIGTWPGHKH